LLKKKKIKCFFKKSVTCAPRHQCMKAGISLVIQ